MAKSAGQPRFDASMRVVVLCGKEAFLRARYTEELESVLAAKFGQVDRFSYDGKTARLSDVLDELRTYGLLQQHKLVVLDHADEFLSAGGGDDEDGQEKRDSGKRRAMEEYAKSPVADATLAMRAETWRKGNLDKLISKVGLIVSCDEQDAATAAAWCRARCAKRLDCQMDEKAARLLVENVGTSLLRLDTELGKLANFVGAGQTITAEAVGQLVGWGRDEKAWEIQTAILTGDPETALQKLRELMDVSRQPAELMMWSMTDLLRKLHAASQLFRRGEQGFAVARQAKIFGNAAGALLDAARHIEPGRFAQLLQHAVEMDMRTKSGIGDVDRSLEGLTLLLTDSVRQS
jgi:DNA polymerase III delta subunit